MTRGQPPNGWYTAKEARGKLGNITDGKLRTLIGIGEGKIERMEPPGAKQGFYKASDVHKIARAWNKEAMGKQHINTPIKFRRMEKKRRWAQVLIIGILKEIVKLGSRGITVDKVYARSDTFQGERMMHRLGFTRLTTTTSHENFVVDIESSGLSFAKQYKAALSKWRIKHEGA